MNSYKNNFSKILPLLILSILLTSCGKTTDTIIASSTTEITSYPIVDQTDTTTTQNTGTLPKEDNTTNSVIYQKNVNTSTPVRNNTVTPRKINTVTKAS